MRKRSQRFDTMSINEQHGIEEGAQDNDAHERSPQEQAFTISLVTETIAGYIHRVKDLGAFRMVNRTCYDASLSKWRKKVIVRLHSRGIVTIKRFMENVHAIESIENYELRYYSLPPVHMSNEEKERNAEFPFWMECGPHIKHIRLVRCVTDRRTLLNLICNLTPNLESLTIINASGWIDEVEPEQSSESWKPNLNLKVLHFYVLPFPSGKFLEYFPNLVELQLHSSADHNLFSTLRNLRKANNFSIFNLKTLNMNHTNHSWDGLDEANLQLEHLTLFLGRNAKQTQLEKVLQSQRATLKTLLLHQCPNPSWTPLSFPSQLNLSVLKELHFWGRVVTQFNFLKWTPSLKVLVMNFQCPNRNMEPFSLCSDGVDCSYRSRFCNLHINSKVLRVTENFQHLNMEHFQSDVPFSSTCLEFLGKWMPNLKVLKIILEDEKLAVVCRQWTKLETLQLLSSIEITDEGLTGLRSGLVTEAQVRKPNITDLKELREFGIDSYYSSYSLLTDASVHNGFLQMPQLKALTIHCSSRVSQNAVSLLKEKIPNAKVYRSNPSGLVRCFEKH